MGKLFATDISETNEFTRKGFQYKKIREDKERHRAVFSVTNPNTNSISCYEVWIGKKHTNPDGTVVYSQQGSESWGQLGFTVDDNKFAEAIIDFLMTSDDLSPEARYAFKKSLK